MKILVAGAGIVGVSCALWLQRAGHEVTLIDKTGPAAGTSHGNAGLLAAGAIFPVSTPGLWRKLPKLLGKNGPFFLRWSYLPKLLPFLIKFQSHATQAHLDACTAAMTALLHDSVDQHLALARGTAAEKYIGTQDYCFGYTAHADYEADRKTWDKRAEHGFAFDVISGRDYAREDPTFGTAFETIVRCKNHGMITDPGAYVKALCAHFCDIGGTFQQATITDIETQDGESVALQTESGTLTADRIVIALGAWSKPISQSLGINPTFETERGYHVEFINPSVTPKNPMMVADGKFVLTPMDGRLRAAGVVELGGLDAGPSRAPFKFIRRKVREVLPDLRYDDTVEWMGHRPSPADSLPLIGASDASGRTYLAYGHQHVGLTGGPKTGRIIADLINGTPPNIDLTPFDPQKYRR